MLDTKLVIAIALFGLLVSLSESIQVFEDQDDVKDGSISVIPMSSTTEPSTTADPPSVTENEIKDSTLSIGNSIVKEPVTEQMPPDISTVLVRVNSSLQIDSGNEESETSRNTSFREPFNRSSTNENTNHKNVLDDSKLTQEHISNYRKRQLYAAAVSHTNISNQDQHDDDHNHDTSDHTKSKFIPSPELKANYYSPSDPNADDSFKPTFGLERSKLGPQSFHSDGVKPPVHYGKWNNQQSEENSRRPVIFPQGEVIKVRHVQQEMERVPWKPDDNTGSKWYWSETEKPPSDSITGPTELPRYEEPYEKKPGYSKGKWKWIPETEDLESKIITKDIQTGPPNYEPVTYYKDNVEYRKPVIREYPPFPFEVAAEEQYYNAEQPPSEDEIPPQFKYKDNGRRGLKKPQSTLYGYVPNWSPPPSEVSSFDNGPPEMTGPIHHHHPGPRSNGSPWKKIVHVLSAAIPLGLIISALTPHVIYVNPNYTIPTAATQPGAGYYYNRFRQLEKIGGLQLTQNDLEEAKKLQNGPLMDFLKTMNKNQLPGEPEQSTQCEDRLFCEISVIGRDPKSEILHRMLWKLANETTEERAIRSGLATVFKAIRDGNCSIFECDNLQILHEIPVN